MKNILVLFFLFWTFPAFAQIYKCKKDDTTVFSDKPCEQNAQKIEIKQPAAIDSFEQGRKDSEELKKKADFLTRKRLISDEISRKESNVESLTKEMNNKLDELRQKKLLASNNLAGAMWEKSLSEEMNAVSASYSARIEGVRREIDRLTLQYNELHERN